MAKVPTTLDATPASLEALSWKETIVVTKVEARFSTTLGPVQDTIPSDGLCMLYLGSEVKSIQYLLSLSLPIGYL